MKSYIPRKVSRRTLEVIRQMNSTFLDLITEKSEETTYRDECFKKRLLNTEKEPKVKNDN
jgi:hypothetical protein